MLISQLVADNRVLRYNFPDPCKFSALCTCQEPSPVSWYLQNISSIQNIISALIEKLRDS